MKTIQPPLKIAAVICGRQKPFPGPARLTYHCLRTPCADGELLFHTLTQELLLLESGESIEDYQDTLIQRRFLVPVDFDDYSYARQVRSAMLLYAEKEKKEGTIGTCMIFPTTDCNARCFYCYELGRSRLNMSDQVAHDAAAYIIRRGTGADFILNWFGGEPLFNRRAIEIITGDLREKGIAFRSRMTTNGYLFDEETVKTAREKWKLDYVQITLDGTEEVYNRTKAYIYRDGSAFRRVLRNIGLLMDSGVFVSVRLNMDKANFEDLMHLSDQLAARFPNRENLNVYVSLLRDFGHPVNCFSNVEEQLCAFRAMKEKLTASGLYKKRYLEKKIKSNRCMADNDHSITILPDGRIGKCEHESEQALIGSIYGEKLDQEKIAAWKEHVNVPACRKCPVYPLCNDLNMCPWFNGDCSELNRRLQIIRYTERILNTYDREKNRMKDAE